MSKGGGRVLVLGAGPAGLAAALGAAEAGADSVLVLERSPNPGLQRRGETLRYDAEIDAWLGPGFFDRLTRHQVSQRRYVSPSGAHWLDRTISTPNRIIDWPLLLELLTQRAERAGVQLAYGHEATAFDLGADGVRRVQTRSADGAQAWHEGACVVAADGHGGLLARCLGEDRSRTDFPIHKLLLRGVRCSQERLEMHLHAAEGAVPGVGCLFPRGGDEVELLLMAWGQSPPGIEPWPLLEAMGQDHAPLRQALEEGDRIYEARSWVPMGGLLSPLVALPRVLRVGDAAGQVQARGGSGIVAALGLGRFTGLLAGALAHRGEAWTAALANQLEAALQRHPRQRALRRMQALLGRTRRRLFETLTRAESFDRAWPLLRPLLR